MQISISNSANSYPQSTPAGSVKDSVLPLCAKHFPDANSKHSWVIALYDKAEFAKSEEFNRLALEFGNEPPEKAKSRKVEQKQSERLEKLKDKYSVKGNEGKRKAGKSIIIGHWK